MALQICCACGYTFRAETEDALWARAQEHLVRDHPELVGTVPREEILAQAELV